LAALDQPTNLIARLAPTSNPPNLDSSLGELSTIGNLMLAQSLTPDEPGGKAPGLKTE